MGKMLSSQTVLKQAGSQYWRGGESDNLDSASYLLKERTGWQRQGSNH